MVTRVLSYTLPSAAPIKMGVSRDNGLTPLDPVSVGFLLPCSIRINKPAPIDQVRISRPTIELQGGFRNAQPLACYQWLAVVVGLKKGGILRN